ncbi:MAG: GNAT family N-acetyltransferase [Ferruginibacter sp.]
MIIYQEIKNDFIISSDKSKLNVDVIHNYLSKESYWAKNIPLTTVQKSIEHSFCFGLYEKEKQIGFARLVTDHATFAYLADVFILASFRGKGLSKWMMEFIIKNPELQNLRRWMLATKDAHGLYAQFGFVPCDKPERLMQLLNPDVYNN